MQYIQKLHSKSDKLISIIVFEFAAKPVFTIIDSPGGFIETKEKTAQANQHLIEFCQQQKINYIAVDFSNNGLIKSQPVNQLRFSHRVKDLETVIDFVNQKYQSSIVLIGSSLGGFITLNTAIYSSSIKGIILNCAAVQASDCIKSSLVPDVFNQWRQNNEALVWGVSMPYDFYQDTVNLNALPKINKISTPILWFHGTNDTIVPIAQAREAKKLNNKIDLIEVQGGGHRFGEKMKLGEWDQKTQEFILLLIKNEAFS